MALAGGISKPPHVSSAAALPRLKNINVRNFRIGGISRGKAHRGDLEQTNISKRFHEILYAQSSRMHGGKLRSSLVVWWAQEP